jgi:hypothetical protein
MSLPHSIQTRSGTQAASYTMGTGASFAAGNAAQDLKLTTHIPLAPRLRMHGAILPFLYTSSCLIMHRFKFIFTFDDDDDYDDDDDDDN